MSVAGDVTPAAGAGSIWVRTSNGSIARVNAANGALMGRYPADPRGGGGGVAVGFGSLWIGNVGTGTVWW